MAEELKRDNEWRPVQAEVTSCERTLLGQENLSSEGYIPAEYQVHFSYLVNGVSYSGSYRTESPQECGQLFEILYDPARPSRNTGSDTLNSPWIKWGAVIIGIGIALLMIWLWADREWSNN